MADDSWLDTAKTPAQLPAVVELPATYPERLALAERLWPELSEKQRRFLQAWRDCRFNARAACRQLGMSENTRPNTQWMKEPDYATVVQIWLANAGVAALDKDRLLARQDDIVETLLTPKPVLHQGIAVFDPTRPGEILKEVEAGAASRANEVLMKAAGLLKDKELEVNVGVVVNNGPPTLNIQVLPARPKKDAALETVPIDAKFTEVPDDEWLST